MDTSSIDAKIQRDKLLKDDSLKLFLQFLPELEAAAKKLNDYFQSGVDVKTFPDQRGAEVTGPVNPGHFGPIPRMVIRYIDSEHSVLVQREDNVRVIYPIKAAPDASGLWFGDGDRFYGAQKFAEVLIAVKLLGMNLST